MQLKFSVHWPLLVASIVGIVLVSALVFILTLAPVQGSYPKVVAPATILAQQNVAADPLKEGTSVSAAGAANPGLPVRLKIPRLYVNSAIEYVGLTPDGAVGVPTGPVNAAWFNLGPHPGQKGSAVIVGHYGWKNGIPAVFDNLSKVRKGDKVYVQDASGATITFVVREVRTYGQNEDATAVFTASDGKAHLNLITCSGVWNKAQKSYSTRLVVFTDRE